jgi:hypothetical protein
MNVDNAFVVDNDTGSGSSRRSQMKNRIPTLVVGALIIWFLIGWVIWNHYPSHNTIVRAILDNTDAETWIDFSCSPPNSLNGTFIFGRILIFICNPYQADQRTLIYIDGVEVIYFSNKGDSNRVQIWTDGCLDMGDKCCTFKNLEYCFFENGNITLKTNKGIFPLQAREGKYLLHVLGRNIS